MGEKKRRKIWAIAAQKKKSIHMKLRSRNIGKCALSLKKGNRHLKEMQTNMPHLSFYMLQNFVRIKSRAICDGINTND